VERPLNGPVIVGSERTPARESSGGALDCPTDGTLAMLTGVQTDSPGSGPWSARRGEVSAPEGLVRMMAQPLWMPQGACHQPAAVDEHVEASRGCPCGPAHGRVDGVVSGRTRSVAGS